MEPVALEFDALHQGIADNPQILAAARGLQIAVIGGDAAPGLAVDGVGRNAGSGRCVVVVAPAIAETQRGLTQRAIDISPIRHRRAIHRDRAAIAVIGRIPEILVGLQLAEPGQHRVPSPPLAATGLPAVEVIGHRADRDLTVDGRTAAHGATAPQQTRRLPLGSPCEQFGPTEIVIANGAHRVRNLDVLGRISGAQILPGLEQQHAMRRILAEARGQRGPGRAATDDDGVVLLIDHARGTYFWMRQFSVSATKISLRGLTAI